MEGRVVGSVALIKTLAFLAALSALALAAPAAAEAQDFDIFKSKVEPIFLAKRPGHARCYACHTHANSAFRLELLPPGAAFWSEEQSRRNFAMASALIDRDHPEASRLLLHPLAPEAGGDPFHSGGRQFAAKDDPLWQTLAAWARGP
jgi:hypothetical protein